MARHLSRNAYSIMQLNLSVTDTILKYIDWTDLTRFLLSKNLPYLNLLSMKLSSEYTALSLRGGQCWATSILRHR